MTVIYVMPHGGERIETTHDRVPEMRHLIMFPEHTNDLVFRVHKVVHLITDQEHICEAHLIRVRPGG